MPRITCRTSGLESNLHTSALKDNGIHDEIKKEIEKSGEQFSHRKSERRRVARDIFLVFEEQPSSRRGRGSNKRRGRPLRSKFGHLKVEESSKTKSLLRDIKNEPKCYLNVNCPVKNRQSHKSVENDYNTPSYITAKDNPIARVNPIFLWVKQDDTRIVEVRCEDYDKRNRIRITKTKNGWRAIPRTDPTSSKIVKYFQTPLVKVKHEIYGNTLEQCRESIASIKNSSESSHIENIQDVNFSECLANFNEPIKEHPYQNVFKKDCIAEKVIPEISNTCCDKADYSEHENREIINSTDGKHKEVHLGEKEEIINEVFNSKDIDSLETYQKIIHTPELQLCPKTGLFLHNICDISTENNSNSSSISLTKDILDDIVDCELECNKTQLDNISGNLEDEAKNLKDLLDEADLLHNCADNVICGSELIDSLVKHSCEKNLIQETEIINGSANLKSFNGKAINELTELNEPISDPPECLSFNEAGEIEVLNEELFQSNGFIHIFDKNSNDEIQITSKTLSPTQTSDVPETLPSPNEDKLSDIVGRDAPKDLSHKKREEVCPPSESRSQCAVTSSSDIIKSPHQKDIPAIESTSDTIKNLIFEQLMKLNSISTISTPISKNKQVESFDLSKEGDQQVLDNFEKHIPATNYIETVVIDDDEPMKKRVRNSAKKNLEEKSSIIDKDPDPLTQLQLLIRNTQWKVPDPILVPKDRLRAVLASPAREIPLLITTRPELRLPEAFAYPEIIQNPNILVVSMAQLEAILKNEMEMDRRKPIIDCQNENTRKLNEKHVSGNESPNYELKRNISKEMNTKCSHIESSLASDLNAATLAVLNHMLWLPYFGKLSQEFIKSLKDPMVNQNKCNNTLPMYNHRPQQLGLQHLDELYKNYVKQVANSRHYDIDPSNIHENTNYLNGTNQNPVELAIFQKILQNQIYNLLSINSISSDVTVQRNHQLGTNSTNKQVSIAKRENTNSLEQKRQIKYAVDVNKKQISNFYMLDSDRHKIENNSSKSNNDNYEIVQSQQMDNKPRLTCKSLSNLLEPDCMTSTAVPLVNVTSDSNKNTFDVEKQKQISCLTTNVEEICTRAAVQANNGAINAFEVNKIRKQTKNLLETDSTENATRSTEILNVDSNCALWHPLFGSNAKVGYSSPWQWTTLTATGE